MSEYEKIRDFSRTPEPRGKKGKSGARPIFVIQKHDASTLHYDFRIEVDGALKSWAVPKGPSTDPREKRLAVPTEDHPLAYAEFEGTIPEGEYGGGAVIVWDTGNYDNITEKDGKTVPIGKALEDGHALVSLHGKKISGGYALQRMGKAKDDDWLLIKMDDEHADARRNPVSTEPESVLSGATVEDIRESDSGAEEGA
ncbi:MAG TPA: DNA polymerase ligase N-terminal domain-containing protein [Gammaproteobacteria bacterium]|nr:DNA polymerase ligase N-terminal domain-containing protein [Gammaproteobacteria bacterium]